MRNWPHVFSVLGLLGEFPSIIVTGPMAAELTSREAERAARLAGGNASAGGGGAAADAGTTALHRGDGETTIDGSTRAGRFKLYVWRLTLRDRARCHQGKEATTCGAVHMELDAEVS